MSEKITVLYVDDELINLQLFELNFKNKFRVVTAESGIHGLDQLKRYPNIKVVISDMRMPEMDGIEFIRYAKKDFPKISYYILTGFDITKEIEQALREKLIQKYLKKPFNKIEIEEAIRGSSEG